MGSGPPPPCFFVSADSREVREAVLVSVDSKRLADGQLRPKHGKTRSWFASVDSTGVADAEKASGKRAAGDCLGKASWRREFRETTKNVSTVIQSPSGKISLC